MSAQPHISIEAGGHDATADIQRAIDTVSAAGGGRVSLLGGRHVTGGLKLKSGVELHLAEDAVLAPASDYEAYAHTTVSVIAEESNRGMIIAKGRVISPSPAPAALRPAARTSSQVMTRPWEPISRPQGDRV